MEERETHEANLLVQKILGYASLVAGEMFNSFMASLGMIGYIVQHVIKANVR